MMKVEVKKTGLYIWCTAVNSRGARYHVACMTEETAEALRVSLNKWHEERKSEEPSK